MQHSSLPAWIPASVPPPLDDNEIHVWLVSLADADCRPAWLDAAERARLERMADPRGRALFCASRSILRQLLAGYLGVQPDAVVLEIEAGGKPVVAGQALHFNLSHARDTLLLAFCRNRPLGIDLEYPRPLQNLAQMARRIFSPQEIQALEGEDDPQERFFEFWTRLEAIQKCVGTGIFGAREGADRVQHLGFTIGPAQACVAWQAAEPVQPHPTLRHFRHGAATRPGGTSRDCNARG